jgi:hypothetical protein
MWETQDNVTFVSTLTKLGTGRQGCTGFRGVPANAPLPIDGVTVEDLKWIPEFADHPLDGILFVEATHGNIHLIVENK